MGIVCSSSCCIHDIGSETHKTSIVSNYTSIHMGTSIRLGIYSKPRDGYLQLRGPYIRGNYNP